MGGFYSGSSYNRFTNLDNVEWKIVDYLIHDDSKYANYLWKILKYDTMDCLSQPDLTVSEKEALVYTTNGDATPYRVFLSPYIDDAWEVQSSHLHIYIKNIIPESHISSDVQIIFECIVHNKISMIYGDASALNPDTNPVEIDDLTPNTPYKSRASEMLKDILASLNGRMVNGVGMLQFNKTLDSNDKAESSLWNNRKFFGYTVVMSTIISGVSDDDECGF